MEDLLDSLLEDLQNSVRSVPQPPNRLMATLTPERPLSPAIHSRLSAGPTYKSSSSSASYEVSQKYTEKPTRELYGSDYELRQHQTGLSQSQQYSSSYAVSNSHTTNNTKELDHLLHDLSTSATSRSVQQLSRSEREESPVVDTKSVGQVSNLIANLEHDLKHSTDDVAKWKLGKEIKPITATTFYEEKNTTYEMRPQPIISSSLRATQPSPSVKRRTQEFEELADSISALKVPEPSKPVEILPKGTCCVCHKSIYGQVVTALNKTWHLEHFTCVHCGIELGKENFFEKNGQPYCEADYHMLFSPKCAYCVQPIIDKCVSALGKTWHPEHFFCCICGSVFGEEGYYEMDGKAYCRHDYFDLFAPKCAGCGNAITDNYISALDAQWHPDCFVCWECRCPFVGGSFFDLDGKPFCETHYHARKGSLCAACNKPIAGRCITAMFRKFHPEHFVCTFCLKQLNKGTFKEHNDKPYCHPCFDRLFS